MSEGSALEHKAQLDLRVASDRIKLVSEIVAMANSEGGLIRLGVADDGIAIGLPPELEKHLDPAKIADLVDSFTNPDHVEVAVSRTPCLGGYIVDVAVDSIPDPPLVICKDGNVDVDGRQQAQFRRGDVLVRRGTRVQRATRQDYLRWIAVAAERARRSVLDRVAFLASLPDGAELQVSLAGADVREPAAMLTHAVQAWHQDQTRLLGPTELAWLLVGEEALGTIDDNAARLLVHSALRKKSTLWHWLARIQPDREWVRGLLEQALEGTDRDVSDAGRAITDVAAVYLNADSYVAILEGLSTSRHKHFRDAAERAPNQDAQLDRLRTTCERPIDGEDLRVMADGDLVMQSHEAASRLLAHRDLAASNRLNRYGLERFRRTPQGSAL